MLQVYYLLNSTVNILKIIHEIGWQSFLTFHFEILPRFTIAKQQQQHAAWPLDAACSVFFGSGSIATTS